jgi:hypothetical protein
MKHFTLDKTQFTLGTSAEDNWAAIRLVGKGQQGKDAFWVHMEGRPSAHAIIHIDVEPTQEELQFAASLIREQTKSAPPTELAYVWCPVANLKLGSKAGEVIIKSEKLARHFSY